MAAKDSADKPFKFFASCVDFPGEDPGSMINDIKSRAHQVSRQTLVKHCDMTGLKRMNHPMLYRFSSPDNWSLSFWKTTFPSGEPAYYIAWSGIEHVFVRRGLFVLKKEEAIIAGDESSATHNPVDDRTRGARKRYGARAALWGLLTALYAAGRDHEAADLLNDISNRQSYDYVLSDALARLPSLGQTGEGLVGWAAHRYHMVERSGDAGELRRLEGLLPRAAYSVMEWSQRARPRPNLFDMSVDEAYAQAKAFLHGRETKGPRQGPIVFRFDDGWTVQDLDTKALLVDEGNHQHICVGQEQHGYPQQVASGKIKVYSLRDPDGRPHVTMTWSHLKGLYESSTKDNGYVVDDNLLARCKAFAEHVDGPDGVSSSMFESACVKASAIADSFDEDDWILSLGKSWEVDEQLYDDAYQLADTEHIQLQHPVMDIAQFRGMKKRKNLETIAREVAENDGCYSDGAQDVYERAFYYLESAIDAAERIKQSLKVVATHVCDREWDDASRELKALADFEFSNWGDTSSETDAMTELIHMFKE